MWLFLIIYIYAISIHLNFSDTGALAWDPITLLPKSASLGILPLPRTHPEMGDWLACTHLAGISLLPASCALLMGACTCGWSLCWSPGPLVTGCYLLAIIYHCTCLDGCSARAVHTAPLIHKTSLRQMTFKATTWCPSMRCLKYPLGSDESGWKVRFFLGGE